MTLGLIIFGWVVFVAFILAFNYGAHKNDDDIDLDNSRRLFPPDDRDDYDEDTIF